MNEPAQMECVDGVCNWPPSQWVAAEEESKENLMAIIRGAKASDLNASAEEKDPAQPPAHAGINFQPAVPTGLMGVNFGSGSTNSSLAISGTMLDSRGPVETVPATAKPARSAPTVTRRYPAMQIASFVADTY